MIEVAPLAFMRGRTLNDSFIILDEAQNTTTEQMKMLLTRVGFNSKAVINGDITQVDLPRATMSGLREAQEVLTGIEGLKFVHFDERDVVRPRWCRRSSPPTTGTSGRGSAEAGGSAEGGERRERPTAGGAGSTRPATRAERLASAWLRPLLDELAPAGGSLRRGSPGTDLRRLNRDFRDAVTDVLSFPGGRAGGRHPGDVVISVPAARGGRGGGAPSRASCGCSRSTASCTASATITRPTAAR